MAELLNSDRRITLGIWGLGRGQSFIRSAKALNIDIVAGCDFHENMREKFRNNCPDAFITDDEDEFLAQDVDAVLIRQQRRWRRRWWRRRWRWRPSTTELRSHQ